MENQTTGQDKSQQGNLLEEMHGVLAQLLPEAKFNASVGVIVSAYHDRVEPDSMRQPFFSVHVDHHCGTGGNLHAAAKEALNNKRTDNPLARLQSEAAKLGYDLTPKTAEVKGVE